MKTAADVLQKIVEVRGGDIADLRNRHNTDPAVVRNRLLAVVLLADLFGKSDDDRILSILDCLPATVRLARQLVANDAKFIAQLADLRGNVITSTNAEPQC